MPVAGFIIFASALIAESRMADTGNIIGHGWPCSVSITAASVPLAGLMFWGMRRMAPVHPLPAGATALLASFGIAALALRLSEPTDDIAHLVAWHYAPMIAITLLGLALGKRFLRW